MIEVEEKWPNRPVTMTMLRLLQIQTIAVAMQMRRKKKKAQISPHDPTAYGKIF